MEKYIYEPPTEIERKALYEIIFKDGKKVGNLGLFMDITSYLKHILTKQHHM